MKYFLPFALLFLSSQLVFAQNSALQFDGASEYLRIAHNNAYNVDEEFTIEAWILAETWKQLSWQGSILTKDSQGPDVGFAFRCGNNGTLSFVISIDNTWEEALSGQIMNLNQWHHVAAVVDASSITLYIDGQNVGNHTFSGSPSNNTRELRVGESSGFPGRAFDGVIDELRVWNDARTQQELNDFMSTDLTGNEDNLVGYFPFNEGSGNVANDFANTGVNAQLINMDDSNWVDGYSLPEFDVSVQSINGIDVVNMRSRPVKMKTALQNNGLQATNNVELSVYINGTLNFTETITNSIASGELLEYEFKAPINLAGIDNPEIEVIATMTDDGNTLNNSAQLQVFTGAANRVIISNNEQHNFGSAGQLKIKTLTMPGDLHRYEQILMHISVSCPSTGCDPWDQAGNIKAVSNGQAYEIVRFLTPFGIACGDWTVDITDFKSVLNGQIDFQNFIQVWGQSGWLLDAQIELIDNNPNDTYSQITPLWGNDYLVYGDPGISYDLDPVSVNVSSNTETNHIRMQLTGHGQGNTNNAAEFFNVTHTLNVGGTAFDTQNLWKSDCASNSCADQNGTWLFPRAGWCPGQEVQPHIFNTTTVAGAGSSTAFDYILQDYTNLLNTGYNGSTHTEPYYRIYAYFVENAANSFVDYRNLTTTAATGFMNGNNLESVRVNIENNGFEDLADFMVNIYLNNELVASESFTETIAVDASTEVNLMVNSTLSAGDNALYAEVVHGLDNNPGDNVIVSDLLTSTSNPALEYEFDIFPNPTVDGKVFFQFDNYWNGSILSLYATDGKLVQQLKITDQVESLDLEDQTGLLWYTLTHPEGNQISGKLAFIK